MERAQHQDPLNSLQIDPAWIVAGVNSGLAMADTTPVFADPSSRTDLFRAGLASGLTLEFTGNAPDVWRRVNRNNQPALVRDDELVTVIWFRGTHFTGRPGTKPQPSGQHGRMTIESWRSNAQQDLFRPSAIHTRRARRPQTWALLFHEDEHREEIRFELSLPASVGEGYMVGEWAHRRYFDPIPTHDPERKERRLQDEPEIDVDVKRRGEGR